MTGFKKALKSLIDWLERKFPDRIEVTMAEWLALRAKIENIEKVLQTMPKIEAEIAKFNVAMGFGGIQDKLKAGPFTR
jgi:hypothetical protein